MPRAASVRCRPAAVAPFLLRAAALASAAAAVAQAHDSPAESGLLSAALEGDDTCGASESGRCALNAVQLRALKADSRHMPAAASAAANVSAANGSAVDGVLQSWDLLDEAVSWLESLFDHLVNYGGEQPGQWCTMSESETCPMQQMPKDKLSAVKPGGMTACMDRDHDYVFEVIPGRTDKLLLYFQGGGACWDEWSSTTSISGGRGFCTQAPVLGTFNDLLRDSVYKDFTVVHMPYCSGDAHIGSTIRPYTINGTYVQQRGYHNSKAAIDWARANVDRHLSDLVVMGCSAGALGAGAWARHVLSEFSYGSASVVADSYAAVFPEGITQPVIRGFGACELGLVTPSLAIRCASTEGITYQDIWESTMADFPKVAFANVNSKQDRIQIIFYNLVAFSFGKFDFLDFLGYSPTYYTLLNSVLERYNAYPNYASFLVTGRTHCFTCTPLTQDMNVDALVFKLADPTGAYGGEWFFSAFAPKLAQWLGKFVSTGREGEVGNQPWSTCAGARYRPGPWSWLMRWFTRRQEWCDDNLDNKVLFTR